MHKFFKSKMQFYGRIKKFRIFLKKGLHFSELCDTIFMLSNSVMNFMPEDMMNN